MKRIDSTVKSPIFADFSQCLNGQQTIRAYGDQGKTQLDFHRGSRFEVVRSASVDRRIFHGAESVADPAAYASRKIVMLSRFVASVSLTLEASPLLQMFMNLSLGRWLGMRVDFLGACIMLFVTLGCSILRETTSGGIVGLLVVNALACVRTFRMGVKMSVDVEAQMT